MDYIPRRLIDQAIARLGPAELAGRLRAMRDLAGRRGMGYVDDRGRARNIDITLKPWILTAAQLAAFRAVVHEFVDGLVRARRLWRDVPAVRGVLRLTPAQEAWLALAPRTAGRPWGVIGRLDSTASYDGPSWRRCMMLEPNAVGVGGVHYAPAAGSIVLDVMGDVLRRVVAPRRLRPAPDPRALLLGELTDVGRRLGIRVRRVALIENTDFTTGTDEFRHLAADLTARGLPAVVADPRELSLKQGRLRAKGGPVDLLYRDSELNEFIDMESGGARLEAMRRAVQEGRLVSGLPWELDQKSVWEIFSDARYARAFRPSQRRLFARHVPWTRLVREARVPDPAGRSVDLVRYIRRHRRRLVLKPNTLFGGQGVLIGRETAAAEWERMLARSLAGRQEYVVQREAPVASESFWFLERGRAVLRRRSTVSGFFFSSRGIGLIGRCSARRVVNVSQGGGVVAALVAS